MADSDDDDLEQRAATRVGTTLRGKYRLDRVLGVGGMAAVYSATHRNGNEFAVKMLHPELSQRKDVRDRFLREGHAASAVKHPGAVTVLDDDVAEDGSAFLVMELLQGESVESLWDRRGQRLPVPLVLDIAIQLLDVLAAAHDRGVVHRDIKPANLFLTRQGQLKVLDFGIARLRDMTASQATQTGLMLGTPAFMAPEQAWAKSSEIDARTDIWAVGATVFSLTTGKLVHEAENAQQIMIRAATAPAPPLASALVDAPATLCQVIDRALRFDKAARWSSAADMRDALKSIAQSIPEGARGQPSGQAATLLPFEAPLAAPAPPAQRASTSARAEQPSVSGWPSNAPIPRMQQLRSEGSEMRAVREVLGPTLGSAAPVEQVQRSALVGLTTSHPVVREPPVETIPHRVQVRVGLVAAGVLATTLMLGGGVWIVSALGHWAQASAAAAGTGAPTVSGVAAGTGAPTLLRAPVGSEVVAAAGASPSAARSAAPEVPIAPAPSASEAARVAPPSSPGRAGPPDTPAAIDAPRPVAPRPAAATAPAVRGNCSPPYEYDAQGTKRWKRECLK